MICHEGDTVYIRWCSGWLDALVLVIDVVDDYGYIGYLVDSVAGDNSLSDGGDPEHVFFAEDDVVSVVNRVWEEV